MADNSLHISNKNVPIQLDRNVPIVELGHNTSYGKRISAKRLEEIAIEKYRKCGIGINFSDVIREFACSKTKAQRKLKLSSQQRADNKAKINKPILFRAPKRTNPQQYFPSCLRAKVIEDLNKKENVPIQPTGVSLFSPSSHSRAPLSNVMEHAKAQNLLDALLLLRFTPPHIHNLHILLSIDKEYYTTIEKQSRSINRGKVHEEHIGKTHVKYTYYPNGKIEILVACSRHPFKIESEGDVSTLFSFLGQVKELLLIQLNDIRERMVLPINEWKLVQCDINNDVEITDKAQVTFPDIQLQSADRVFRFYVKNLQDKAVYRAEESLKLNLPLVEALDNFRNPYKSIEDKLNEMNKILKTIAKQGAQL